MDALHIENLTKEYPGFKLDGVHISLPRGTIMGIVGENGAGKSTTIKAALGLIRKDEGKVTFWGQELTPELKQDIGVVFDGGNFHETITPDQVGRISQAAYRRWDDGLYGQYLTRFDLPRKKEIKGFSKGMKMKLSIAVALAHHPRLLILDEATAGLDPVMRDDILEVLLDFVQDEDHAILMSSHITTDLERIADYITFIHQGKVCFSKPKDELRYCYGIIRCGAEQFAAIDPADILAWRQEPTQRSVLVADKAAAKRKYPEAVVDDATIDDILLIYVKGEVGQ